MTAGRKRILIIDDDEALSDSLRRLLELEGFEIRTAVSGTAGLSYAVEHRPDLIVLDVRLPGLGGYDVCRELRRLYHPWVIPVLMLTGMDKPIDQLRGFAYGADAYLTKPCQAEELVRTINMLLGQQLVS